MNSKVRQEVSDEAYVFINNHVQIESKNTLVVYTSNPFNILNNQQNSLTKYGSRTQKMFLSSTIIEPFFIFYN